MGIFGALTTSVAGLRSNSYALENISGNIANSQTTAFKRIDTSFLDLIPQTGNNAQLAGSVTSESRLTNTIQGSVQSASVSTYMAINGEGFFQVQLPNGTTSYTRDGSFQISDQGALVTTEGYTVVPGDTLWSIAERYTDSPWRWNELWNLNKDDIKNPHRIYPGNVIVLELGSHCLTS